MTKIRISFAQFFRVFFHPRVFLFLLAGTGIIFLTFLTHNNATEIAISGIASVFIGIGVNNFTSHETKLKEESKSLPDISFCIQVMEMAAAKVGRLSNSAGNPELKNELLNLQQFIKLGAQHIKEEAVTGHHREN